MIDEKKLFDAALKARELSYSPYSKYAVGAAVLMKDGSIVLGANIENAAYGLCMCGERNAIYGAYCRGYNKEDIEALCIATQSKTPASPCGACRQVIFELLNHETPVYLINTNRKVILTNPNELLPLGFSDEDL